MYIYQYKHFTTCYVERTEYIVNFQALASFLSTYNFFKV